MTYIARENYMSTYAYNIKNVQNTKWIHYG